jgi:hypothetical protein
MPVAVAAVLLLIAVFDLIFGMMDCLQHQRSNMMLQEAV